MSVIVSNPIDYKSTLWQITKKRAKEELNERDADLDKMMNLFRDRIQEIENLDSCLDDDFLVKFLRIGKFNLDKSTKALIRYYELKKYHPYLMQDALPSKIRHLYYYFKDEVLKERDNEGRCVAVIRLGFWRPEEYNVYEYLRMFYLAAEYILFSPLTQINGLILVIDCTNLTFDKLKYVQPKLIFAISKILQGSLPLRFAGIHVVNHSYVFKLFYSMIAPFLKDKVRNRFHFHGNDMKSFWKFISPRSILPTDLGGDAPIREINTALIDDSLHFESTFEKMVGSGFIN